MARVPLECIEDLPGPYEDRPALDEVVQMMGGLTYMTGPSGRPLRAGASVVDILGGTFGVVGILAALHRRRSTGQGELVHSALYESVAFLMGQHMAAAAVNGEAPPQIGEGGRGYLKAAGFEDEEIELLRAAGVLQTD